MLPEDIQAVMAKMLFMIFAILILFSSKIKAENHYAPQSQLVFTYTSDK